MAPEAFYLPAANGYRFCLYYPPSGSETKAALIYLHPFAEEMNKSRRMVALQARLLAEQGYAVLQIDLHGCGDSSGDFGDATWESWLEDVVATHAWLRSRCDAPLWLWGLRSGCLLAAEAAPRLGEAANFLFWQPVISGKQFLQQFLRLKVAGAMMNGDGKTVMEDTKRALASGEAVEVAGYALSANIAQGLEATELLPPQEATHLAWLEVSARTDPALPPASLKRIEQWQSAGIDVRSAVLPGPTFWQTTEIEEAPALHNATLAALMAFPA